MTTKDHSLEACREAFKVYAIYDEGSILSTYPLKTLAVLATEEDAQRLVDVWAEGVIREMALCDASLYEENRRLAAEVEELNEARIFDKSDYLNQIRVWRAENKALRAAEKKAFWWSAEFTATVHGNKIEQAWNDYKSLTGQESGDE